MVLSLLHPEVWDAITEKFGSNVPKRKAVLLL